MLKEIQDGICKKLNEAEQTKIMKELGDLAYIYGYYNSIVGNDKAKKE